VNVAVQRDESRNYRDAQYDYGDARRDERGYRQVGYRDWNDGWDD
jgi:hypothetical protein